MADPVVREVLVRKTFASDVPVFIVAAIVVGIIVGAVVVAVFTETFTEDKQ